MAEIEVNETFGIDQNNQFPLDCYVNRELSWLKFNARVLEEANDIRNPICERLQFVSIFQSNLDEFFMVRVGGLFDQRKTPIRDNKSKMTPGEQLSAILSEVRKLLKQKDTAYFHLMKQLRAYQTEVVKFADLSDKEKRTMERYFLSEVLPLLSPQIIAPKQPFPFLNSKDIYAVVLLKTKNGNERLGIIPCSNPVLRRLIPVSQGVNRYVLMEDIILHFAQRVFENYHVSKSALIRIVRNADISIDDPWGDTEGRKKDYRKAMEKMIQTRKKLAPIKLEFSGMADANVISMLCDYLGLSRKYSFYSQAPLDLSFLSEIFDVLSANSELFFKRRVPQASPDITENERVIDQVRRKDVLLSYPYESMRPFLRLLNEAARDPEVASIKITLYRMAKNSQVAEALMQAAENGKEVIVLVELRARFDEENNVEHSKDLEKAGCRIIYGIDNIKIHSKLCLITAKHEGKIEYITQIGTGNYNEKTAKLYTDYSLITSNQEIGEEAASIFNGLALGQVAEQTSVLLAAPKSMQNKICDKLDLQIRLAREGKPAYAAFKVNSITDKVIIDKLIEASVAGVKIQLIVRGICCIVSGIPGYTENIEVYSIVGRYLEHGRVYIFGANADEVYISSGDLMTRNQTRRVEIGVPILDSKIKSRIMDSFGKMLSDNVKLRRQNSDGSYSYVESDSEPFCSQEFFAEDSYRACGNILPEEMNVQQPENKPAEKESLKKHLHIGGIEPKHSKQVSNEPVIEVEAKEIKPAEKKPPVQKKPAAKPVPKPKTRPATRPNPKTASKNKTQAKRPSLIQLIFGRK